MTAMIRACKSGGGVLIQESLDLKDTGKHVRWRTFSDYAEVAAGAGCSIDIAKQYRQPAEPVEKTNTCRSRSADYRADDHRRPPVATVMSSIVRLGNKPAIPMTAGPAEGSRFALRRAATTVLTPLHDLAANA